MSKYKRIAASVAKSLPFQFDEDKVKQKFASLNGLVQSLAGQKGYNPYAWHFANVTPLVNRYMKGERTKELFDLIVGLPSEIPKI